MKRKLLSFIMLFTVAFCFVSGCDNKEDETAVLVKDGKEIVATINGVNYSADDIYEKFVTNSTSAEYLYEELEDLLIKSVVPVTNSMRSKVENEIEKKKKEIKENSTANDTSYQDNLEAYFEEEGVSSEEELIEKKLFEQQEQIITNQYWNNNEDSYYLSYIKDNYVYHISQILVSVSTNGNYDYFNVEPGTSASEKIYNIINELSNGETFYNVALRYSDDSDSKDNGGDLGLVSLNDTDLSDEMKYALANYSIYFEGADLDYPTYMDTVYGNGIEAIPQEYVDKLNEENSKEVKMYDDSSTYYINTNTSYLGASSRTYGRNIIFNNLFNSRTFRFVQTTSENSISSNNVRMPKVDEYGFDTKSTQNILAVNGSPVIVFRDDSGIHFMLINKSPLESDEELEKYYSLDTDYTDNYVTYLEKSVDETDKEERQAVLEAFAEKEATMEIGDLTANEDFVRYDMFKSYLEGTYSGVKFEITNAKIKNIVLDYINSQKEYAELKISNAFDEGFKTYSNNAEFSDNSDITKEIPLLNCLDKACKYDYANGFAKYTTGGDE